MFKFGGTKGGAWRKGWQWEDLGDHASTQVIISENTKFKYTKITEDEMTKYKNKEVPDYHSPPLLPLRREMGNQFEDISQRVADFSNNHRWGNFAKIQTSVSFQDNEGRYEQYTGQVGSDGDEAGDETNLSAKKS